MLMQEKKKYYIYIYIYILILLCFLKLYLAKTYFCNKTSQNKPKSCLSNKHLNK